MQSSPSSSTAGGTGFSVRWGRLAIFGIGALALVVAVICAIAGLFGAATWLAAGLSLLITAASYGVLRGLVVMNSKKRAREREQLIRSEGFDTSIAQYATQTDQQQTYVNTNDEVFDMADEPADESIEADVQPVAHQPAQTASVPVPSGTPVPRPMYLDAPEVEREAPAPMETPQEPTPSPGVQLSEGVSSQYQQQITQKANTRLDLDKVLNRRRAI